MRISPVVPLVVVATACFGCAKPQTRAASPAVSVLPTATASVASAPIAPAPVDVAAEASELVLLAQRRQIEGSDVGPMFELFAADMKVRAARSETVQSTDLHLDRARIEAVYTWSARHVKHMTIHYENVEKRLENGAVYLSLVMMQSLHGQGSAFGQKYKLEKRDGTWLITELEYWPLVADTRAEFGAAYFANLDAQIEALRDKGDLRNLAYALMSAYRFAECSEIIRRLTVQDPTDRWAWGIRATASAMIGDLADADASSAQQERLPAR